MRVYSLLNLCILAALLQIAVGQTAKKCRGVKARKHAIVTTASCVKGLRLSNLNVWTNKGRQQVQEVIGHPRYLNSSKRTYDIAVLKLAKAQPSNSRRLRAKIARKMPKKDIQSYVLDCEGKAIPVTIMSTKDCNKQKGGQAPMDVICAYRRKLEDKRECQPLRGSPLVSGPYLVGIFTGAQEPQKPLRKDGGYVLMHTSAIGHRKWLRKMLQSIDAGARRSGNGARRVEGAPSDDQSGVSLRINGEDMADEESSNKTTWQDTKTAHPATVLITTTETPTEESTTVATDTDAPSTTESATNATTLTGNTSTTQFEITRRFQSEGTSQEATDEETSPSKVSSYSSSETLSPSTMYTSSSEEISSDVVNPSILYTSSSEEVASDPANPSTLYTSSSEEVASDPVNPSTLYTSSSEELSTRDEGYSTLPASGETEGDTRGTGTSSEEQESSETDASTGSESTMGATSSSGETQSTRNDTASTSAMTTSSTSGETPSARTEAEKSTTANTAPLCALATPSAKKTTPVASDNDDEDIDEKSIDDDAEFAEDEEGEDDEENDDEENGDNEGGEEDHSDEGSDEKDDDDEGEDDDDEDEDDDDDEDEEDDDDEDEDDESDDDEDEETESSEEYSSEERDVKQERQVIVMAGSGRNLRKIRPTGIRAQRQRDGTLVFTLPKTAKRGSAIVVLGKH